MLGVAFRANTDDIRDAPSLPGDPELVERGAVLRIYDPQAASKVAHLWTAGDRLRYTASSYEATCGADALLILIEWGEFRSLR